MMIKNKKSNRNHSLLFSSAFTLIETLLVVSIIALLASLILPNLNVKNKALSAVAKENLRQLENSLALFELDHGYYPGVPGVTESNKAPGGWSQNSGSLLDSLVPEYISQLPDEPTITYIYDPESCPGNAGQSCSFTLTAMADDQAVYQGGPGSDNTDNQLQDLGEIEVPFSEEEPVAVGEGGECSDDLDNDHDGKIDFEDFGCLGPNGQETNTDYGWTLFEPHADTKIIYVSSSLGNDAWSGTLPEPNEAGTDGPVKTIVKGGSLLRNGQPDWLLLRRGDTWESKLVSLYHGTSYWQKSGLSAEFPILVSSYGPSTARPRLIAGADVPELGINYPDGAFIMLYGQQNVAIVGLEFYDERRDPTSPKFFYTKDSGGLGMRYVNNNILLEDNRFRFAELTIEGEFDNLIIRRNVIDHNYATDGSHSQGIYAHGRGKLLIEENVLYHNGWNDDYRFEVKPGTIDPAVWAGVTNGYFRVTLGEPFNIGKNFDVTGVSFAGVSSMDEVAQRLEVAINAKVGTPGAVTMEWTGLLLVLKSNKYVSSDTYKIATITGQAGTDLSVASWLNAGSLKEPNSDIYNRNMYLTYGYGNTTVRGNIDASGSHGGVQLRMGGLIEDNLYLRNPISISIGHTQNPSNSVTGGTVRRNVILGGRNVDEPYQPQGTGIQLEAASTTAFGINYLDGVYVYDNIIAHNVHQGSGNVKAIALGATKGSKNVVIHDNLVYNWRQIDLGEPNKNLGKGLSLSIPSTFENASFYRNQIIQPNKGFIINTSETSAITAEFSGNTYYSTSLDPGTWSSSWFGFPNSTVKSFAQWVTLTGDTSVKLTAPPNFRDPNRDIDDYAASIGLSASYEAFINEALKQSRFNWRPDLTAYAVNEYIREGFELAN